MAPLGHGKKSARGELLDSISLELMQEKGP